MTIALCFPPERSSSMIVRMKCFRPNSRSNATDDKPVSAAVLERGAAASAVSAAAAAGEDGTIFDGSDGGEEDGLLPLFDDTVKPWVPDKGAIRIYTWQQSSFMGPAWFF